MRACMPRPFREALASTPVVLEIVPPGRRVSEKAVNTFVERVRDSVRSLENLDAVNIPEVLEENHDRGTRSRGRSTRREDAGGLRFLHDASAVRSGADGDGPPGIRPAVLLAEPETLDRTPELRARLGLPGHRIPCLARGHGIAEDGRGAPPFPRWPSWPGVAGGRAHVVVASPCSCRAIASSGAARSEHRGGLDPQLRPRGADGPRVPLVARRRGGACDSGPRTGRPRSETKARSVMMPPMARPDSSLRTRSPLGPAMSK